MVSRFAGALMRALMAGFVVIMPLLLVPARNADLVQVSAFLAFLAVAFVFVEYVARAPSLIEFRDAPPFNRLRFAGLVAMLLVLSLVARGSHGGHDIARLVALLAARLGEALNFPYSPIRLVTLALPAGEPAALASELRAMASAGLLIAVAVLAIFVAILRLRDWPRCRPGRAFNLWVNLPTFSASASGDIVWRLERDATINVALGLALPFALPALGSFFGAMSGANEHGLIWMVAAWAFLPASLLMRGFALGRLAAMIRAQRTRKAACGQGRGWQPAS